MTKETCTLPPDQYSRRIHDQTHLYTPGSVSVKQRFSYWPRTQSGSLGHVSSAAERNENATRYGRLAADAQGTTARRKADSLFRRLMIAGRQYTHCAYPKQALVMDGPGASFLRSLDIDQLSATVPLPVESQPHMPMLIHSCK